MGLTLTQHVTYQEQISEQLVLRNPHVERKLHRRRPLVSDEQQCHTIIEDS